MKLILIDGFYMGRGRGVGNYIENLVLSLSKLPSSDVDIVVVCAGGVPDIAGQESPVRFLRMPRLPFPLWENLLIPLISAWLRPDIIHFPANSSSFLPVSGRRLVTIHDTIFLHSKDVVPHSRVLRQRIGRIYLALNARLLAARYERILTVSHYSKMDIQRVLGVIPERIAVLHEGPGLTFSSCDIPLKSRKIILHFASRDPRKNTQRVIDAFCLSKASRSGYTLHLIGSSFPLDEMPSEIQGEVRVHKFLPVDQLQALVDRTYLLLYPSLYEGFGMPIVEFQRLGIPVVTSNTSACAEVGASGSVLVDPENVNDIARGIDAVCNDYVFGDLLGKAALENALRFQWDNCAKGVLKEYASI